MALAVPFSWHAGNTCWTLGFGQNDWQKTLKNVNNTCLFLAQVFLLEKRDDQKDGVFVIVFNYHGF